MLPPAEYVRPSRKIKTVRRRRFFPYLLLVLLLVAAVYAGYLAFGSLLNSRFIYEEWALEKATELNTIARQGVANLKETDFKAFSTNYSRIDKILDDIKSVHPGSSTQEENRLILYEMAVELRDAARLAERGADFTLFLAAYKDSLDRWKESYKKLKPDSETDTGRLSLDLTQLEPRVIPSGSEKPGRRGLAVISISTRPKPVSFDEKEKMYLYEHTDLMDVTVEVQNQGEETEHDVVVYLLLKSSNTGIIIETTRTIDVLSPGETKPVTFVNLLPDPQDSAEHLIKVVAQPVPGEAYIFNNEKYYRFRWK